jgi:hypothetical protein
MCKFAHKTKSGGSNELKRFRRSEPSFGFTELQVIFVIAALTVVINLICMRRQISEQQLESIVAHLYPVAAVKFVNERNYSGLQYNHFIGEAI